MSCTARDWCCGTPITGPHIPGCPFEPREDNPVDYDALIPPVPQHDSEVSECGCVPMDHMHVYLTMTVLYAPTLGCVVTQLDSRVVECGCVPTDSVHG
jgi:hypothetical protein